MPAPAFASVASLPLSAVTTVPPWMLPEYSCDSPRPSLSLDPAFEMRHSYSSRPLGLNRSMLPSESRHSSEPQFIQLSTQNYNPDSAL